MGEIAKKTDSKTLAMPARYTEIRLALAYDDSEMERIRAGFVPEQMQDKWFMYFEKNRLYMHRSWTGHLIYIVNFVREGDEWRSVSAIVNRDSSEYTNNDDQEDVRQITKIIKDFLLFSF